MEREGGGGGEAIYGDVCHDRSSGVGLLLRDWERRDAGAA